MHNKMLLGIVSILIAMSLSLTFTITSNQSYGEKYFATLNGSNSFPPVDTNASGMAEINIEENNSTFSLRANDIHNATVAHIHKGIKGENGPHVFTLFAIGNPSEQQKTLEINGTINSKGFEGPLIGKSMSDLTEMMNNGTAYINIHTEQYPKEFLRGKIVPDNVMVALAHWLIS